MKATTSIRGDGQNMSLRAQEKVWSFFQVLELRAPEAELRGKQRLQKICDEAVELSLMMRSARDRILLRFPNSKAHEEPISEWEHMIEEVSAAPAKLIHQSGRIACVYTGALVKYTKENPIEMQVLEKAEAVVYVLKRDK